MMILSKPLQAVAALAIFVTLAGCESILKPVVDVLVGDPDPIEVRPSNACDVMRLVRGPGEPGSDVWRAFWDDLEADYPDQSEAVRGNNQVLLDRCNDDDPAITGIDPEI